MATFTKKIPKAIGASGITAVGLLWTRQPAPRKQRNNRTSPVRRKGRNRKALQLHLDPIRNLVAAHADTAGSPVKLLSRPQGKPGRLKLRAQTLPEVLDPTPWANCKTTQAPARAAINLNKARAAVVAVVPGAAQAEEVVAARIADQRGCYAKGDRSAFFSRWPLKFDSTRMAE